MHLLDLEVAGVQSPTPLIKRFTLRAADGGLLPGYEPGAHLRFELPLAGGDDIRHYSLVNLNPGAETDAPEEYVIAVRLETDGGGGSRYMHERLAVGARVRAHGPINEFPLAPGETPCVLIAGGIGITPLASMTSALAAAGRDFRLHYSGRCLDQLAFREELSAIAGDRLILHADDDPATRLDVDALLGACTQDDRLYVCGPRGMIDAVIEGAKTRGWPAGHVHFELFSAPEAEAGDHAFDVECRQSGVTVHVPADRTILEVLTEAGVDPLSDCQRGECGVCSAAVLEGEVDHRDYYLSDAEKASNEMIQICVSRAKGDRLVLDL